MLRSEARRRAHPSVGEPLIVLMPTTNANIVEPLHNTNIEAQLILEI